MPTPCNDISILQEWKYLETRLFLEYGRPHGRARAIRKIASIYGTTALTVNRYLRTPSPNRALYSLDDLLFKMVSPREVFTLDSIIKRLVPYYGPIEPARAAEMLVRFRDCYGESPVVEVGQAAYTLNPKYPKVVQEQFRERRRKLEALLTQTAHV